MLIRILSHALATHKRLVVPQLGAFLVKEPGREVVFSELIRRDDGVLRSLLTAEGMSEVAAAGEIDRFVFEVRHALKEGGEFRLEGLGQFRTGANGTIAFRYNPAETAPAVEVAAAAPVVAAVPSESATVAPQSAASEEASARVGEHAAAEVELLSEEELVSEEPKREPRAMTLDEPQLSVSVKMNPASYVKGLKYGKPPKNTNGFSYVDKPQRRGGTDRFIWFALVAILLALGAIAFGLYHDWSDAMPEESAVEQPMTTPDTLPEAPAPVVQPE